MFEGGSIAGVGSDAWAISISQRSITVSNAGFSISRWLSFTLVDLADSRDREGGGNVLVR